MKFLSNITGGIKSFFLLKFSFLNKKRKVYSKKFIVIAEKRPIGTFIVLLLALFSLIILSNLVFSSKKTVEEVSLPQKEVSVYSIGTSPKLTVQAQIEKSGVIKIVALSSGVVQSINVEVGQEVGQGTNLVAMSTNYQGGNILSVSRQLAQAQYGNVLDTYKKNKEIIDRQIEIAEKSDENGDKLREISSQSISETQNLINLNNDILAGLNAELANPPITTTPLAIKQMISQFESANSQLKSALRNTEYSSSGDNPPAEISDLTKEITTRQLEVQRKALGLNKEVSRLNLLMAQINEAIMFPSSPISGIVERIYIREGQVLNPGMPIAQISGDSKSLIAVALLSREIAEGISQGEVSTLHFENGSYDSAPFYVSHEATDGSLYSAQFAIPKEFSSKVTDKGYVVIDIPLGFPKTGSTIPFVPIDSVFQTQDQAFLFVVEKGKANSRRVKLGQVLGQYVEIKSGLNDSDQVILNRNVISGDLIRIVK